MTGSELLTALKPFLVRSGNRLMIESAGLEKVTRSLIADHAAPELYDAAKAILIVISAIEDLPGGDHAAGQLRRDMLEPVLNVVTHSAKGEMIRRHARLNDKPRADPMLPPKAKGVRSGPKR